MAYLETVIQASAIKPALFAAYPLVWVALSVGAGIALAEGLPYAVALFLVGVGAGFLAWVGLGKGPKAATTIGVCMAFAGLGCLAGKRDTLPELSEYALPANPVLRGQVQDVQRLPKGKTVCVLDNWALQNGPSWRPMPGKVLVRLTQTSAPAIGQEVALKGYYVPNLPAYGSPFWQSYRESLQKQGVVGTLYIKNNTGIYLIHGVKKNVWYTVRAKAQTFALILGNLIDKHVGFGQEAAVAKALLLGTREGLTPDIELAYKAGGVVHLLVVSGGHLALLWAMAYGLLVWLPLRWQGRGRWAVRAFVLLGVWGFAFVTGLGPSMVRAATMLSLLQVGLVLQRPAAGLNALAGTVLFMLLAVPSSLFSVGFQLSVACVYGLMVYAPPLYSLWAPATWVGRQVWILLASTFAAQLGALPVLLWHFGQVTPWFWLANPPALVLSSLLLWVLLALILLAVSPLPALTIWLGKGVKMLVFGLNHWVFSVAALPGALQEGLYISAGQAIVLLLFSTWLVLLSQQLPLVAARRLLAIAGIWVVATCTDLYQKSTVHTLALGYNPASRSYYWLHRQGLTATVLGQPTPEVQKLASLWGVAVKPGTPPKQYLGPYVIGNTVIASSSQKSSIAYNLIRGKTKYNLAYHSFYILPQPTIGVLASRPHQQNPL